MKPVLMCIHVIAFVCEMPPVLRQIEYTWGLHMEIPSPLYTSISMKTTCANDFARRSMPADAALDVGT